MCSSPSLATLRWSAWEQKGPLAPRGGPLAHKHGGTANGSGVPRQAVHALAVAVLDPREGEGGKEAS